MSQALLLSESTPSVSLHDGRPATTSLEIAKFFDRRHDDVVKGIRNLLANCPELFSHRNFAGASYLDEQAKNRPMYIIHRDGFMLLVMGYTGKKALALKLAYIEAFNRMEAELAKRNRPTLPAAPRFDEAAMLELAAEIREAQQQYYRTFGAPVQQADHHEHSRLHSTGKPRLQASSRPSFLRRPHRSAVGTVLHRAHDRRPALP